MATKDELQEELTVLQKGFGCFVLLLLQLSLLIFACVGNLTFILVCFIRLIPLLFHTINNSYNKKKIALIESTLADRDNLDKNDEAFLINNLELYRVYKHTNNGDASVTMKQTGFFIAIHVLSLIVLCTGPINFPIIVAISVIFETGQLGNNIKRLFDIKLNVTRDKDDRDHNITFIKSLPQNAETNTIPIV
jgi:hypothetical protein